MLLQDKARAAGWELDLPVLLKARYVLEHLPKMQQNLIKKPIHMF